MSITTEYIKEPSAPEEYVSTPSMTSNKLESTAFYIFLATIILAPLAFLPTPYIALDAVKTLLIALGTIISAVLYGVISYKDKKISLPPRGIFWASIVVGISVVASSLASPYFAKSFFGQGFELSAGSFMLILFLAALVGLAVVHKRIERVTIIYTGMVVSFLILAILHGSRFIFGASFASLGILSELTTTILGSWYDIAAYSVVIIILVSSALIFLPLSRRTKIVYWVLLASAASGAFLINSFFVWMATFIVFIGVTLYLTSVKSSAGSSLLRSIAWFPLVICLIAGLFAWKGTSIAGPVIDKIGAGYNTLSLPWQVSLDVAAGAIKDNPILGAGPNGFSKAYITYKPITMNGTYAWNTEFNYAVSLVATFVATQGIFGLIAWIVFLGLLVAAGVRVSRKLPQDPYSRFTIVSSSTTVLFLWIISIVTVPSHTLSFFTYVFMAIALGSCIKAGSLDAYVIEGRVGSKSRNIFRIVMIVAIVFVVLWGIVYVKNAIAVNYFGSGVKALTVSGDAITADTAFAVAQMLNPSDIYLRARAEAGIIRAKQLIAQANAATTGTTSQALVSEVSSTINTSVGYAQQAIVLDKSNYYNYVSEARVSELASNIKMEGAYENTVNAYSEAIKLNPLSPSLYLTLAQFQASQNKLDDALKTVGAALQVKNNYLEAIFLLSQITAAQGNLKDAIIAAQVGTQINPQSPVLFFQLGLLQYTNKDYTNAVKSLESAIKLQAEYANAQYFLGLSYARVGNSIAAIAQFEALAKTNPDNQEVNFILTNLMAGKSPFADAKPPVTPTPEKRSTLPISEKKKK